MNILPPLPGRSCSGAENRCYSPVSLYLALAMAGACAAGDTQAQIYALLGAEDTETLAAGCRVMLDTLQRDEEDSKLYLANSVWTRQGIETNPITRRFWAGFFCRKFFCALWAGQGGSEHEHLGRTAYQGLLKPQFQHEADTVAVLLNTIYFKDGWTESFLEGNTERGDFTTAGGETVRGTSCRSRVPALPGRGRLTAKRSCRSAAAGACSLCFRMKTFRCRRF